MGHKTEITSEAAIVCKTTLRIRALNDRLRTMFEGGASYLSAGIDALPSVERVGIITAVRAFDAFTEDNDPWGEHDCATLTVGGHEVMFKVDYYDAKMRGGSPDPSDKAVTRRVLTILLTSEY